MREFLLKRVRTEPGTSANASPASLQVDDEGVIQAADDAAEALFGYGILEMQGLAMDRLVASREDNPLMPLLSDALEQGQSALITVRHASGYFFTINLRRSVSDTDASVEDTMRIRPRQATPLDTRMFRLAEQSGGIGIWEMDADSNRLHWSEGLFHLLDLPPGNQLDPEHVLFYFQENQNQVRQAILQCVRRGHHRPARGRPLRPGLEVPHGKRARGLGRPHRHHEPGTARTTSTTSTVTTR